MKLETSIKPRRDGTVTVGGFGDQIVFVAGEDGALVADVPDRVVAALIATGNFYPAEEANFAHAAQIVQSDAGQDDGDGDGEGDDDEGGEEDAGMGGAPIEAATPPKLGRKPRKAKE